MYQLALIIVLAMFQSNFELWSSFHKTQDSQELGTDPLFTKVNNSTAIDFI